MFIFRSFEKLLLATFVTAILTVSAYEGENVGVLPELLRALTPYYDGQSDTVYLFGGLYDTNKDNNSRNIYSFSLTHNYVIKVGEIPSDLSPFIRSYIIPRSNSEPYAVLLNYLVPQDESNTTIVYLFNGTDGSLTQTGVLPVSVDRTAMSQAPNGDVYFFGGFEGTYSGNQILKVNLESENIQFQFVAEIQQEFYGGVGAGTVGNTTFLFGGVYDEQWHTFPHITVDLETLESSDPKSQLPDFFLDPVGLLSVITIKDEIFILGGYFLNTADEILKMNGTTQDYVRVDILNPTIYPGARWFYSPAAVYVEKLNRIYFFGGSQFYLIGSYNVDRIWYINL